MAALLERVEPVEWLYDGLNGKIIPWTKAHGGTSDDPSDQAFLVGRDGTVLARCPGGQVHAASSFASWLKEQLATYEREHPRTRLPFVPADIEVDTVSGAKTHRCKAYDAALSAGRPVLVYVGRERVEDGDKPGKAELTAARKLERTTLDSKTAAEAAAGWTLLRLDLSQEADRAYALGLGVRAAPALVVALPAPGGGLPQTQLLPKDTTGAALAAVLKKHAPAAPR